jgi:DNA-nicking Smr family endonuclease
MSNEDSEKGIDEMALFQAAMRDVAPLAKIDKIPPSNSSALPFPRKKNYQEQTVAADTLSDHISTEIEAGDEWSYARAGMPHQTLRRLRRGYWKIQGNLDLHGLTRDAARQELSAFLEASLQKKLRCVRVIHGKGLSSKNRAPVLKIKIGNWLLQRPDILAFCQAKPEDGGGGAILILLKASV